MKKIFLLILTLTLMSCATGPRYVPAPKAPEGKALVYLMRDSITYGGGYRTRYSVNDRIVAALYDRGYTWLYLDKGDHKIKAGNQVAIRLKVDSGETHYVMYSQVNKTIGSVVSSENLLKPLKYQEIADRLHKFRYKPSNDYATAKLSANSDYPNDPIPNGAKLSLKLNDSTGQKIKLNAYLIDNPEKCFYRRKHLNHSTYDGSLINIPTEGPQTLLLQAKPAFSLQNSTFCSAYVTLYPKQNENLELSFDIDADENGLKVCNASMTNLSNQEVYKFIGRPRKNTASLASPRCASEDLISPKFITNFEFKYLSN